MPSHDRVTAAARRATRVTCTDLSTGESESIEITDNYVLVTDGTCEVSSEQHFANGTVQLTIKRPSRG